MLNTVVRFIKRTIIDKLLCKAGEKSLAERNK